MPGLRRAVSRSSSIGRNGVKVWLDANLDPAIAPFLGSQFNVFVSHIRELGLQQSTDVQLFEAARRLQVTLIVSKDSDFVDLVTLKGSPPKIMLADMWQPANRLDAAAVVTNLW